MTLHCEFSHNIVVCLAVQFFVLTFNDLATSSFVPFWHEIFAYDNCKTVLPEPIGFKLLKTVTITVLLLVHSPYNKNA